MGSYMTSISTTTRFHAADADKIKIRIQAVASGYPSNYGWRETVLNAATLQEIAEEFGVMLHPTDYPERCIIPILKETYRSSLFRDILPHISEFFDNGHIDMIDSDGRHYRVTFRNGKAKVKCTFDPLAKLEPQEEQQEDYLPFN